MSRPVVLAMTTPAFCETVKGGDVGEPEVPLLVVEPGGGRATITVFVGLITDMLKEVVEIVHRVELVVARRTILEVVAPSDLVLLSLGVGSVEVFQSGAREVYEVYRTVLLELACCAGGTSAPPMDVADSGEVLVNAVFQPPYADGIIDGCCSVMSGVVTVTDVALLRH